MVSIGDVMEVEISSVGELSPVGVAGTEASEADEVSTIGVAGAGTSGVGVASTADDETSGIGSVLTAGVTGVEISGEVLTFLGCLTWANWICLTRAENESKEPVNCL